MELTEQLLGDSSPYIANLIYDIDVRMLFIELLDGPESQKLVQRVVFPGVVSYSETNLLNEPEDDSMALLMGAEQDKPVHDDMPDERLLRELMEAQGQR